MKIAEIKLSYSDTNKTGTSICSSKDAYRVFSNFWDKETIELFEEFNIILLKHSCEVLGVVTISKGGVAGAYVDCKLIFSAALKCNASSIILGHNHPSGNLKPSPQDLRLTRKIEEGSKVLDLKILDHIIVSKEGFYSFKDEGQMHY